MNTLFSVKRRKGDLFCLGGCLSGNAIRIMILKYNQVEKNVISSEKKSRVNDK